MLRSQRGFNLRSYFATGCLILLGIISFGCQVQHANPDEGVSAAALNAKGMAARDPVEAKRFFEKAIQANPLFGPAYNNLGVVYFNEGDYFKAASALDQAIKLLPGDSAPRIHLGLVYENAGQFQNALEQYQQALVNSPESMEALQALTRSHIRMDQVDPTTIEYLKRIGAEGTDATWRTWAQQLLTKYAADH